MGSLLPVPSIPATSLLVVVVIAGIYDFRFRRIPNWLSAGGIALGFVLNAWLFGTSGVGTAAAGVGLAALIYIPLYLLRGMGAGDVKLMAAVAALAGPANWLLIFIATSLIGGVLAICLSTLKGRLREVVFNVGLLISDLAQFRLPYRTNGFLDVRNGTALRMPHGLSIALGTWVCLTWMPMSEGRLFLAPISVP